ncbi:uncharacterized protein LOC126674254 [Mercurialis annua]|uniref:uncharacterized protein LOC126674254 n=1 Tax=Mercurialis annua TaxID=3986 RepID=UPI0021605C22|nr:uncharacterized protein LOC126674254 [Mercurialis annua]
MENILVFVHYNGRWNQNMEYIDFEPIGIVVNTACDYNNFQEILYKQLQINHMSTLLEIKYQVRSNYPPLKISDNVNLSFYLELKKNESDCMKYPLCISTTTSQKEVSFLDSTFTLSNADIPHSEYASKSTFEIGSTSDKQGEIPDLIHYAKMISKNTMQIEDEVQSNFKEDIIITDPRQKEIKEGQIYKDKEVLKTVLSFYAINNHFQFKVQRSCDRQYTLNCLDSKCTWQLKASRKGKSQMFMIRKLNVNHICSLFERTQDQRQATANIIADCIKSKFVDLKSVYKPADIRRDMKELYGINIGYTKAWRSKEIAEEKVRGNPADSFNLITSYLYMITLTNPGSAIEMEVKEDNTFLYVFMALNASIKGWEFCIPVIIVDGTFLTSAYGGTLLTASSQDGNGKIFPLAFCIVDSENNESWEWFMERIRDAFQMRNDMCIVSDRHDSIVKATEKVFPEASHTVCTYHLYNNMKKHFKKSATEAREAYFGAAKAYTTKSFDYYMKEIDKINKKLRPYLKDVGYKKWTRAHCGKNRHGTMTTNIAESLNAKIQAAKDLPITTLLEYLRSLVQEWSYSNRFLARSTFTALSKRGEDILNDNYIQSLRLVVSNSTDTLKSVIDQTTTFIVDLEDKTCTCRKFQLDGIPCPHAMAILKEMNQEPYKFCSRYYKKETLLKTYEATVYPIEDQKMWAIPEEVTEMIVETPLGRTKSGRPKKRRFKSISENSNNGRCSRCKLYGHNRKTCRNMPKTK